MKLCQPSASQSKSTQTRPSSWGSRKTCEPLDPCCFRFSRLVVEKTLHQRSKSSTLLVARNNSLLLCRSRRRRSMPMVRRVYGPDARGGIGGTPYAVRTRVVAHLKSNADPYTDG